MPIELEIDHGRRIVSATARGALGLPDITAYFAKLISDAALPYRKIFDGREAWLDLAEHPAGAMAASVRAMATRGPRGPVAIVATTPSGIAGAHLFMRIPAADRPTRLFATLDAARAWLNPQDAPPTNGSRGPTLTDFAAPPDPVDEPSRRRDAMSSSPQPIFTPEIARRQARKARRLASDMLSPADRDRLLSYAWEMEERASELEASTRAGGLSLASERR